MSVLEGFWLKWFYFGLSPRRPGLNPSPLRVGCWVVIHVMALAQAPLRVILSPMLCECNIWVSHVSLLQPLRDLFRATELPEKLNKHENMFKNAYF
jgi:hypothetical protein